MTPADDPGARSWDATPQSVRGSTRGDSPEMDSKGGMELDAREWEEEQVRLDRDWYSSYDEGPVVSPFMTRTR